MCQHIKTLHNFEPPATKDEIHASALQFVRKLSGSTHPSKANEAAFNRAVEQVTQVATELLEQLVSHAPPRRPRHRGGESAGACRRAFRLGPIAGMLGINWRDAASATLAVIFIYRQRDRRSFPNAAAIPGLLAGLLWGVASLVVGTVHGRPLVHSPPE